jgi:hypothetical protein
MYVILRLSPFPLKFPFSFLFESHGIPFESFDVLQHIFKDILYKISVCPSQKTQSVSIIMQTVKANLMYVCPCIIYENDERYQLDATIIYYYKKLYMFRASICPSSGVLGCIHIIQPHVVFGGRCCG